MFGIGGQRVDEIQAVLHAVGGRARRNRPLPSRVDRKAERLCGRVVLAGVVDELVVLRAVGRDAGRARFQPVNTRAAAYTSASV